MNDFVKNLAVYKTAAQNNICRQDADALVKSATLFASKAL